MPTLLQWQRECIQAVCSGNLDSFKTLLANPCNKVPGSVVHIRGFSMQVSDIGQDEVVDTLMWNPLHFAVYYNQLSIAKFILTEMQANFGLTVQKCKSEFEKEPTNISLFADDKIIVLTMALSRGH